MKSVNFVMDTSSGSAFYVNPGILYAFCTYPDKRGRSRQISPFHTCREDLARHMFTDYKKVLPSGHLVLSVRHTCYGNISLNNQWAFEAQTSLGLRVLNILEDYYGWPRTEIYHINPVVKMMKISLEKPKKPVTVFLKLLVGCPSWVRSPHMLSLFTLLFRAPTQMPIFIGVENYNDLKTVISDITLLEEGLPNALREHRSEFFNRYPDAKYLSPVFKYLDIFMGQPEALFEGLSQMYNCSRLYYSGKDTYHEGIHALCCRTTYNRRLLENFDKLRAEKREDVKVAKAGK